MIRALVSIGTNSTRLLVLDGDAARRRGVARHADRRRASARPARSTRRRASARSRRSRITSRPARASRRDARSTRSRPARCGARRDGAAFGERGRGAGRDRAAHPERSGRGDVLVPRRDRGARGDDRRSRSSTSAAAAPSSPSTCRRARARAAASRATFSVEIGAVRLSERHPALLGARALGDGGAARAGSRGTRRRRCVLAPFAGVARFRRADRGRRHRLHRRGDGRRRRPRRRDDDARRQPTT